MVIRMSEFLETPAAMLLMEEMGALRQSRASNGDLVWYALEKGEEILRNEEALAAKAVARRRPAIKKDWNWNSKWTAKTSCCFVKMGCPSRESCWKHSKSPLKSC